MTADLRPSRVRQVTATVRFRVAALATLVTFATLAITGVGLVLAQKRLLSENLEESLGHRLDDLAVLVSAGELQPILAAGGDDTLAQVVGADGRVAGASPAIAGRPPISVPPPPGRAESLRTVSDLLDGAGDFRLLSRRVASRDGPAVIHVAGSLDDLEESVGVLTTSLTIAVPVVATLLASLIWWVVGRPLRSVEAIRAEVADIGGSDLHRRVPEPGSGDEIDRLARTMNGMLDRVEDAGRRQQRFVADASHELRTPLTRIRSEIEVDLARPSGADLAATHRSVLQETTGLSNLVDNLLHLARSDAGAAPAAATAVDLDDIVLRHASRLRSSAEQKIIDSAGVGAAQVRGDAAQLARAVGNLADNAARHATTTVAFTLAERGDNAVLTVGDDGPGIPPDDRERVFDRFTRLEDARDSATGGTGLGLAIARDIVERHGGTIAIVPGSPAGTDFVVTLPREPVGG